MINYNVIYVYSIPDEQHKGYLKIGKTSFNSDKSPSSFPDNCSELREVCHRRIKMQTATAKIKYVLEYCTLARKQIVLKDGYTNDENFSDIIVHNELYKRGYKSLNISDDKNSEWFKISLHDIIEVICSLKNTKPDVMSNNFCVFLADAVQERIITSSKAKHEIWVDNICIGKIGYQSPVFEYYFKPNATKHELVIVDAERIKNHKVYWVCNFDIKDKNEKVIFKFYSPGNGVFSFANEEISKNFCLFPSRFENFTECSLSSKISFRQPFGAKWVNSDSWKYDSEFWSVNKPGLSSIISGPTTRFLSLDCEYDEFIKKCFLQFPVPNTLYLFDSVDSETEVDDYRKGVEIEKD